MYGVTAGVSIGDLFLAGIVPGVILAILVIILNYFLVKNMDIPLEERKSGKEKLTIIKKSILGLLMPVLILGGIYSGAFTPTESAAVAAVYAIVIGLFVYKELDLKGLYRALGVSALSSAVTLIIISFSVSFAYLMTRERIPTTITNFITGISESPIVILLLILLLLLFVGMFIDAISSIVVLTPILSPIATTAGVDSIHFGIIMITALAIGFVTPPLGVNLFVASNIGKVSFERISVAVIPFVITLIVALLIITFVPFLSTFIPNLAN